MRVYHLDVLERAQHTAHNAQAKLTSVKGLGRFLPPSVKAPRSPGEVCFGHKRHPQDFLVRIPGGVDWDQQFDAASRDDWLSW
jgi:hypothetical protein